ncbi:hypothetical protein [Litorimonas sp. WD9-15]|uniref:hypothetical protein n=1 Tax=Litorimonas sp. WD9-15 TaxID=3418716 RepID=UPI003D0511E8
MEFFTYPLFAVLILGAAGVTTLLKKKVPHGVLLFVGLAFLAGTFFFPEQEIALVTQAIFAAVLFLLGWIAYTVFGVVGAGVYKALAIVALWIPLHQAFDVYCAILILTGLWAGLMVIYEKLVVSGEEGAVPMAAIGFLTVAGYFGLELHSASLLDVVVELPAAEQPVMQLR